VSRYTNDPRWKRVRARVLDDRNDCERCGEPATDVHHKDERGLAGPEGYEVANCEALCHSCHSKITARFGVGRKAPRKRPAEAHPGLIDPMGGGGGPS
jgi:5-methylcytosine-specific restriction endonuclease McrA